MSELAGSIAIHVAIAIVFSSISRALRRRGVVWEYFIGEVTRMRYEPGVKQCSYTCALGF